MPGLRHGHGGMPASPSPAADLKKNLGEIPLDEDYVFRAIFVPGDGQRRLLPRGWPPEQSCGTQWFFFEHLGMGEVRGVSFEVLSVVRLKISQNTIKLLGTALRPPASPLSFATAAWANSDNGILASLAASLRAR